MEKRKLVIPNDIKAALKEVGVKKGQAIMVHTSLSSLGYVCGGAQSVIEALLKSATYRQYFGSRMLFKMILEKYKEYGLIEQ